jgi:hypothetical protein
MLSEQKADRTFGRRRMVSGNQRRMFEYEIFG